MSRPVVLVFACLTCLLVLPPLTVKKPGLPMRPFGEEATYFGMAASLAADGDLRFDEGDLRRLFNEFPFAQQVRLDLELNRAQETARYTRPLIYPLLAAPFAAVAGANGLVALNACLFVVAVAFGWLWLRRFSDDALGLLYVVAFYSLSGAFLYIFRMQPQVLVMTGVTVALSLALVKPQPPGNGRWWASGFALGISVLQQPALGLLAVPLLIALSRQAILRWLAGFVATLVVGGLVAMALGGSAWPGMTDGGRGQELRLDSPLETLWPQSDGEPQLGVKEEPARLAVSRGPLEILGDAGFRLWGRRHGILPYFPLLIPLLALVFGNRSRDRRRKTLFATLAVLTALALTLEPVASGAYADQIGNPDVIGFYPAFLFLLSRLTKATIAVSYALGALIMASMVPAVLGPSVPGAGLHAHTRSAPFRWLPFEYPAIERATGYERFETHGNASADSRGSSTLLWAPTDQAVVRSDELWLRGGQSVELWLTSRSPLASAVFNLRNLAPGNRIAMRLAGQHHEREFTEVPPEGVGFRLEFDLERPDKTRRDADGEIHFYRLRFDTRHGEKPRWRQKSTLRDYVGVAVAFLGTREHLATDLYAAQWLSCGAPPVVQPGEEFLAAGRLRNASDHPWPHLGSARVRLSYRWLDAQGAEISAASLRTELNSPVEAGQELATWVSVLAPQAPGQYRLIIEPIFENVAWFSSHEPQAVCGVDVRVGD